MPPFPDIQVCLFDAYGTLFDVEAAVQPYRTALGDQAEAFAACWRHKHLSYTWLRSLMGRHADFWQVTEDALDYALDAFGLSDPAVRVGLLEAYLHSTPYPDAAPALTALRQRGLPTAVLSNGTPSMLESAATHSGLHGLLDVVLSAETAGVFKPHPRVYRLATDHFAVAPDACLFCTANAWDASGAAAFGLRVAWINRRGALPERLPGTPDVQVASLHDVPALIDVPA